MEDNIPPPIYVKIVPQKLESETFLPRKLLDNTEWKLAPNYSSYAFQLPTKSKSVKPDHFILREWKLSDLIGEKLLCTESKCAYFLKFQYIDFLGNPPLRPISYETEWFYSYKLIN